MDSVDSVQCPSTINTIELWNSLSLELRNSTTLESFKNNYRNNLFDVQQKLHHFVV